MIIRSGDFAEAQWYSDPFKKWEECPELRDLARVVLKSGYNEETVRYLGIIGLVIRESHRILCPTGHVLVECDPPTMHKVADVLDLIFGSGQRGENITWEHTILPEREGMVSFAEGNRFLLRYRKSNNATFQIFRQPPRAEYIDKTFRQKRAKEVDKLTFRQTRAKEVDKLRVPEGCEGYGWELATASKELVELDDSNAVVDSEEKYRWQSMTTKATRARPDLTRPWCVPLPSEDMTVVYDPAERGCSWDDIPNDDPRFAGVDPILVASWTIQQKFDYFLGIGHIRHGKSHVALNPDGTRYRKGGEPHILQPMGKSLKGRVTGCIWKQMPWTQGDVYGRPDETIDHDVQDFAGCVKRYLRAIEGHRVLLVFPRGQVDTSSARQSNFIQADANAICAVQDTGRSVLVVGHHVLLEALDGKPENVVWRPRTMPDVRAYKAVLGASTGGHKEFEGCMLDILGTTRNNRQSADGGTDQRVTCNGLKVDIQATAGKPSANHFKAHVADTQQHGADLGLYYTLDQSETPTKNRYGQDPDYKHHKHFTVKQALEGKRPPIDGWDERVEGWPSSSEAASSHVSKTGVKAAVEQRDGL